MCLLFCLKHTRWGAGPGPVAIDREWCVLTWQISVGLGERPTSLAPVMEDEGRDR